MAHGLACSANCNFLRQFSEQAEHPAETPVPRVRCAEHSRATARNEREPVLAAECLSLGGPATLAETAVYPHMLNSQRGALAYHASRSCRRSVEKHGIYAAGNSPQRRIARAALDLGRRWIDSEDRTPGVAQLPVVEVRGLFRVAGDAYDCDPALFQKTGCCFCECGHAANLPTGAARRECKLTGGQFAHSSVLNNAWQLGWNSFTWLRGLRAPKGRPAMKRTQAEDVRPLWLLKSRLSLVRQDHTTTTRPVSLLRHEVLVEEGDNAIIQLHLVF